VNQQFDDGAVGRVGGVEIPRNVLEHEVVQRPAPIPFVHDLETGFDQLLDFFRPHRFRRIVRHHLPDGGMDDFRLHAAILQVATEIGRQQGEERVRHLLLPGRPLEP
jgi:hypothetical protein